MNPLTREFIGSALYKMNLLITIEDKSTDPEVHRVSIYKTKSTDPEVHRVSIR